MVRLPMLPIIQGGMGAGVSGWELARTVSMAGQLGVVAGTGLDIIMARRLQLGDPGGHLRRALGAFPIPGVADRLLDRWFVAGGKDAEARFRANPVMTVGPSQALQDLVVAANFAEVFLAREGHDGPIGVNYLEKIQLATLPALFGAMLAGVDVVLMGGGIPRAIPGVLDRLAAGAHARLRLDVKDAHVDEAFHTDFDSAAFCDGAVPGLTRPHFLAIVSSAPLARMILKRASGAVSGFVVELPTAGGHNAPPRDRSRLTASGEPLYGARDAPDLAAMRALDRPFWLAGSYGRPGRLAEAQAQGAVGIQVGTAFAYCRESGLTDAIKGQVLAASRGGTLEVFTDPNGSPTGFPFKVVQLPETLSDAEAHAQRKRVCDLGQLRHAYRRPDGRLGWRCPGEPVDAYVRKGGSAVRAHGSKCLCNGLMADIGLGQLRRDGSLELPLVTAGDDVRDIARFAMPDETSYGAADVIRALLS